MTLVSNDTEEEALLYLGIMALVSRLHSLKAVIGETETEASVRRDFEDIRNGRVYPVEELWDGWDSDD